jgi:hypothetical protein
MSASERIDVLAVMKVDAIAAEEWRFKQAGDAFAFAACKTSNEARAAVAELIESGARLEAITVMTGHPKDDAAVRRFRAALARVQGEPHGH